MGSYLIDINVQIETSFRIVSVFNGRDISELAGRHAGTLSIKTSLVSKLRGVLSVGPEWVVFPPHL